jgi:hypothetical protein
MRLPTLRTLSTPMLLCAALLPLQALQGAAAASSVPSSAHPLLGIWVLSLPTLRCAETYHFRGDGTTLVKSAGEVSESEFTITEKPSAKGFYKLEDRIVKDNGKQDCSGEVMKIGTSATNYIRFHPSGARFVMCRDESMQACIGPFERKPAEGI